MSDNKEEEKEIWKQHPDYPFIQASNLGRVRTRDRYVLGKSGSKRLIKGRVLKQCDIGNGYLQVDIHINGKHIRLLVHRIIVTSFIPNPNNLPEVNHIDCNPTNNRLDNLEWCTHQENIAYRDKLGHTAKHNKPKKPVIAINIETSEVFWFESQSETSRQLGVFQQHVNAVVRGRLTKTHGYWFCHADKNAVEKVREKFGSEIAKKVEKLIRQNQN